MPAKAKAAAPTTATRRSTRSQHKSEPIIILDSSPSPIKRSTVKKPNPTPKKIALPVFVTPPSSPIASHTIKVVVPTLETTVKAVENVAGIAESRAPTPARELSRFEREDLENAQASSSRSPNLRSSNTPMSKAKAPAIVIGDSEDEDDIFNMSKKVAPVIKTRLHSPQARKYITVDSETSSESDEEESRNGRRKRKKKQSPTKPPIRLRPEPEWARSSHSEAGKRERDPLGARNGSTSTVSPVKSRVATNKEGEKRAVSLTPPPEIDPAQLAAARKRVQEHLVQSIQDEDDEAEVLRGRSASPVRGRIIVISLRMVADPQKASNPAMVRALRDYCKLRTFRYGLKSPLDNLYRTLAERIKKTKDDLVLTYRGQKVASSLLTPEQLGIDGDCTFEAYEKPVYDAIRGQKRKAAEERLARLNQTQDESEPEEEETKAQDTKTAVSPSPPSEDRLMRLLIRDAKGTEVGMKVKSASLCKNMVAHFCKKAGLPESAAEAMRLYVDGEKMEPDEEIGNAGLEAGDVIDVR